MTGGTEGVSAPLCLPAAPGRAPASRGPVPPAVGCSKRLGGSRALLGGLEEHGRGRGEHGLSPQAGLAGNSRTPNSLLLCCRCILASFEGLKMPCPGH